MMSSFDQPIPSLALARRIQRLQWLTIGWMTVEFAVALITGIRAHSVALIAFGGDSGIELASAAAVLWRFVGTESRREQQAAKVMGWLLIALAAYIVCHSLFELLKREQAQGSVLGIALLVTAAVAMPLLARSKRQLAASVGSASLRADAAQSSICGYMAVIALAGLVLNTFAHIWWADPLAALALLPIIVKESREAFSGRGCMCAGETEK